MRAVIPWLGALLVAAATTAVAQADPYYWRGLPPAPDACGQGFYCTNQYGMTYGPNYYLRPPWEPFNGVPPRLPCNTGCGPCGPWFRSPRDFFMMDDP